MKKIILFSTISVALMFLFSLKSSAQHIENLTSETFKEKVWDYKANPKEFVYKGDKPAIIDFYADWCRPCKMLAPVLKDIQEEYKGKLVVYKVNTQYERELAGLFNISGIPALLFVPMKGELGISVGLRSKEDYKKMISNQFSIPEPQK